jgi:hypothetical protein
MGFPAMFTGAGVAAAGGAVGRLTRALVEIPL